MSLTGRLILSASTLVYLLFAGGVANGYVWCFADHGEVSIELELNGRCVPSGWGAARGGAGAARSLRTRGTGQHCGRCVDIPLGAGCPEHPNVHDHGRPSPRKVCAPVCDVRRPSAQHACMTQGVIGRSPPVSLSCLSCLRTVILLS